jgi:nucleotide-binding universal stress UspA family protein
MSAAAVDHGQGILVGYDGTEPAREALATACDLVDATGRSLHVVIAARRIPRYGETMAEAEESLTRAEQTRKRYCNEVDAYCDQRRIEAHAIVRPGRPLVEVLRTLRRNHYDVLVLPVVSGVAGLGLALAKWRAGRLVATVIVPSRDVDATSA